MEYIKTKKLINLIISLGDIGGGKEYRPALLQSPLRVLPWQVEFFRLKK
jgi:hypothetical protein